MFLFLYSNVPVRYLLQVDPLHIIFAISAANTLSATKLDSSADLMAVQVCGGLASLNHFVSISISA